MLATFADLYRQEVAAEEDVHRTLPFFGTALGIVIGALAYAAGRLPKWTELATHRAMAAFAVASVLLALAIVEAGCVLVFLSRAIARRDYQRIGAEAALRGRLATLQAAYAAQGITGDTQDGHLVKDMRQVLLDSYTQITPLNRGLNEARYRFRSRAVAPPAQLDLGACRDHCHLCGRQAELSPEGDPMSAALPAKALPSHLLGPVTYTISRGADVWPGIGSSERPLVRVLGQELAIFQEFRRGGKVAVSIGGHERIMPRAEWKALPAYEG